MTIEKGRPWGVQDVIPAHARVCRSDRDLAQRSGPSVLFDGDLWRALGRPTPRLPGESCTRVSIDRLNCVVEFAVGTREIPAASHLRIGRWLGRGRLMIVSNSGFIGELNVAPRAHPNDGVFDIVIIRETMAFRERVILRRRARLGLHLPHPDIDSSRADRIEIVRGGRERLVIDGQTIRGWRSLSVTLERDSLTVFI